MGLLEFGRGIEEGKGKRRGGGVLRKEKRIGFAFNF